MKKIKKSISSTFALLAIILLTSNSAYAHFGSKGPFGGSVSCSTTFDSVVYVGTANGGVYRSSNSQLLAWTAMPVGLKSGKMTALAHSGSYLFAGTLDSGVYIFNGYIGTDRHWIKINNGLSNLKIKSLIALDSITLLVGTEGGGLYKTADKGATWTAISNPSLNNAAVTALVKAGNRIFASTMNGGVFVSFDGGNMWSSFNDANTLNVGGTIALAYNAATNELAVINKNGLFTLSNASATMMQNFALAQTGVAAGTTLRSVATNGTNWYLATDKGVYSSLASSMSWAVTNAGLPTMDVMVVLPFRTNLVVGTSKEGIYKSDATTISWKDYNTSFNNLVTYSMETSGATVVVAATEKGVFVSTDLAATYKRANTGLTDSLNVNYVKFLGSNLYAATKNGGIFVSADTGRTWTALNGGLSNLNIKKLFSPSTSEYNSPTNLFALDANNGLFQWNTSAWVAIQTGLPTGVVPTSMAFFGSKILLGTMGQGAFVKDGTANWAANNAGLSNLNVTSVTTNGTKLFVGTEGSGVFVSEINAVNWKATSPVSISHTTTMGLDGSKILEMAFNAGYVYASYKGGLLATSDNGATWIAGGNQFNLPSYTNVSRISFVTTRVFVTTENNCLYSNSLTELPALSGVNDLATDLNNQIHVSPNPNNGSFTIDVKDLEAVVKDIVLYDNVGRVMQTFVNNKEQQITVTAHYPAGVYFVRLNTDKGIAVRKVVIE